MSMKIINGFSLGNIWSIIITLMALAVLWGSSQSKLEYVEDEIEDLKIKKAEVGSKELSSKLFCLSEEELWGRALKKYSEMYSLIFILRKNHTLRDIKVQKYKDLLLY